MRTRALAPILLLLLAGCSHDPPAEALPPGQLLSWVEDPVGDAPEGHDLVGIELGNLNGSLLIVLRFDNVSLGGKHPFTETALSIQSARGGKIEAWAHVRFDPTRGPPNVLAIGGIQTAQGPQEWETCQATRTGSPARLLQDLVHARTGLEGGGTVTRIQVTVRDAQGMVHDTAQAEGSFAILGGRNPYVPAGAENPDRYCPLLRDPSSPQRTG